MSCQAPLVCGLHTEVRYKKGGKRKDREHKKNRTKQKVTPIIYQYSVYPVSRHICGGSH